MQRWTSPRVRLGTFFVNSHKNVILSGAPHRFIARNSAWLRAVEGPRRCLLTHAARGFPTSEARSWRTHHGLSQHRNCCSLAHRAIAFVYRL